MNNDIPSELTKYINPRTKHDVPKRIQKEIQKDIQSQNEQQQYNSDSYETTQKYLNTLGHAKVSMDNGTNNRIINSLNILKNNPDYVQNHIDFCDMLQERGYNLEDAIIGTDIIFDELKKESTYKS